MKAGDLRHRVDIQANTPTQNELLENVDSWATAWSRWAKIEPLQGRDLYLARQYSNEVTHRVTMRWFDGLTPRHRIVYSGRNFSILSILNPEERRIELNVMCKELI